MKQTKVVLYWSLMFVGFFAYLQTFNTFLYGQQEEVQAFVPSWSYIRILLQEPGGLLAVAGQWATQYYRMPFVPFLFNALLLTGIGCCTYRLLQQIADRGYHLLLALLPALCLLKVQLRLDFVADGTIGFFLLLLALTLGQLCTTDRQRLLYGLGSVLMIYLLTGQWALLYGLLWLGMSGACRVAPKSKITAVLPLVVGAALTYYVIDQALALPLTEGIYSLRYQESQLQPDSLLHFVAIRFTFGWLALLLFAFLLSRVPLTHKPVRWGVWLLSGVAVAGALRFVWPGELERQARWVDRLATLSREERWAEVTDLFVGKPVIGAMSLTQLNVALAHQGRLGDELFLYTQQGPQSLLAGWDRTYAMSVVLSDVHYAIGDFSTSESYAMEGLTLARRGGSPRMLQRLAKISLIRRDFPLANKYLERLRRMPMYRAWAARYQAYVAHPERIAADKELAGKRIPTVEADSLLGQYSLERLWLAHEAASADDRLAWTYLGCSYLLARELDAFGDFLRRTAPEATAAVALPRAFQEAALLWMAQGHELPESWQVQPAVAVRFDQFRQAVQSARHDTNGVARLYRDYGHTFWFYFYQQTEQRKETQKDEEQLYAH
ncbi:MAG: DUF6057 family protein [Parabacteroides sp.]